MGMLPLNFRFIVPLGFGLGTLDLGLRDFLLHLVVNSSQ